MSKIELPPLPPVVAHMHSNGEVCAERRPEASLWPVDLVDASELRARDRQIVELCAQIAEDEDYRVDGRGWDDQLGDAQRTQWNIAAAIRALLADPASISHPQAKDTPSASPSSLPAEQQERRK